ncbi:hypothetical protein GCM10023091_31450 [Ravibacter arvi]|uniref:Calx-beta domain-containing protein n=1 Tax=Ravibacter arvi TaxID=2051041 RepID=A0ABP8M4R9_9BACT
MIDKLLRSVTPRLKTGYLAVVGLLFLLQAFPAGAQITESFEDEGPAVGESPLRNFSQGGISFTTQGKFVVFGNTGSAYGANGSHYYLHTDNTLTSANGVGGFSITTPATSFHISSFAAYIASDLFGNNPTNGTVTFTANLAAGGTVTENVTINTTNIGSGYDLSNSFTGALNAPITSLTVTLPSGIQYIDLDDIVFTTAPIVSNQYSINDVSTLEGNSGTKTLTFTVSRTQTSSSGSVTATTVDGSASAGTDYAPNSQVINFGVGESSKSFNVTINGDVSLEPNEFFSVNLSAPVNGVILKGTGVGTILDDDSITENFEGETTDSQNFSQNGINFTATGALIISPNGGSVSGGTLDTRIGNGGTPAGTVGTFGITTLATSFNLVSIQIFTSANDGVSAQNGTVTFTGTKADGSGTVTHAAAFSASGNNFTDVNFAGTPFSNIQLTSVSVAISPGLNYLALDNMKFGTNAIVVHQVSIGDAAISEGTGPGNTNMAFTLTRSNNTTAFSVDVALAHVTTSSNDFVSNFPPTTVNFTAGGALTQDITVAVNRDAVAEPNEVFHMVLSNSTNGVAILDGLGVGTINDDDGIIERFEGETPNATTFSENGIAFNSTGHFKVRSSSGLGSGPSNFFLDTGIGNGGTPTGSAGSATITTANTGFKLIAIDAWTSNNDGAEGSQSSAVIKFKGTRTDGGGTVEVDKNISPSGDMPGGWVQNIAFSGTPLENVVLNSLEVIIVSGANYVALDNFSYVTANSDPEIEVVNAADQVIADGSSTPSVEAQTDFGAVCLNGTAPSISYTIKNLATLGALSLTGSPAVTLSGPGASNFSVTTQPAGSVGSGQTTSFTIQLTTGTAGTHDAVVTIANNDLDENPYTFAIRGTVNALPSAVITAASEVCQTADLALSVPSAGAGATYTWGGNGLTASNTNAVVANPVATGTQQYTVSVVAANGCSASSTHSVTVNAANIPASSASVEQVVGPGSMFANSCSFVAKIVPSGNHAVAGLVKASVWVETGPINGLVGRHYEIAPATDPEISTGTVTLYFTQGEFDAYNQTITADFLPSGPASGTTNVQVVRFAGVSDPNDGLPQHYASDVPSYIVPDAVTWDPVLNHWAVTFQVTSGFSGFFIKSASQAMPVTLVSFQGKALSSGENQLNWVTADEEAFSHFEIMRSGDAQSFETIGHVDAAQKQPTQLRAYQFIDTNPRGQTYYRLKMVDIDGSVDFSDIISIRGRAGIPVVGSFYPNPVTQSGSGKIDVYTDRPGVWKIRIFDALGREVHSESRTLPGGLHSITVDQLGKGMNLVHFSDGHTTLVRKVIRD